MYFFNKGVAEIFGEVGYGKPLTLDTMVQNMRGYSPTDLIKSRTQYSFRNSKETFSRNYISNSNSGNREFSY
jgi:hypothetical protein